MVKERLYDDVMVDALRDDPAFAQAYLHQAFLDMDEDGGRKPSYLRCAMWLKPEEEWLWLLRKPVFRVNRYTALSLLRVTQH